MNYGELKAAVSEWLARNDITAREETFIEFAENRINRALKIRHQETAFAELIGDDGTVPVPADWDQWRTVFIYAGTPGMVLVDAAVVNTNARQDLNFGTVTSTMRQVQIDSPENLWRELPRTVTGVPCRLARVGDLFYVAPKPAGNYTLAGYYFRDFPNLSDTVPTNWLSENSAECYLYGAIAEAAAYVKDATQYTYWNQRFETVINELQAESELEKHAGSTLQQRIA